MRSQLFSPGDKTFAIPLKILLVVIRHMLCDGTILTFSAMESGMRADAMILVKDFNDLAGHTHIHLMLDVFIGDTVMHLLDCYVIIELYAGNFPEGQLVGWDRQRLQ